MWKNNQNKALQARAERVMPGGMYGHESTQLLPPDFPQFFQRAEGTRLWDVDGNEYIDYMCAFGPNLLGYGNEKVEAAARAQAQRGDTMTGPSDAMVRLAELFVDTVTHADWAMFCKNGTDATEMALVCARAHRQRRKVLLAQGAYHGAAPWCMPQAAGGTPEDRAHIIPFRYNDVASLAEAVELAGDDLAGIFATPFRHEAFSHQYLPAVAYAKEVRRICDERDALLVVDDVRAGFRMARDCSWSALGVQPDLSTWGKAIANGHPISALLGSDKARTAATRIYVTGSFWFSAVPMEAAIATLHQIRESDYLERIVHTGQLLRDGLDAQAESHGFTLRQTGPVQMPQIFFADDADMRLGYAWTAAVIRRGAYLHPYHNMFINSALTPDDVAITLERTDDAFAELRRTCAALPPQADARVIERIRRAALVAEPA